MRILIVASNASSRFGGEAFIPLNYFRLLRAKKIDVWLIVHARNRPELVLKFPEAVDRLFFVDDTLLHKTLFRIGRALAFRGIIALRGLSLASGAISFS